MTAGMKREGAAIRWSTWPSVCFASVISKSTLKEKVHVGLFYLHDEQIM